MEIETKEAERNAEQAVFLSKDLLEKIPMDATEVAEFKKTAVRRFFEDDYTKTTVVAWVQPMTGKVLITDIF